MSSALAVPLTGILVASACALLGNFLILRRMAMMSDAISHAILPGLVAGYVLAQGPNLLAGFIGASLAAIVTVTAVEAMQRTRRVDGGAAIGIVFPAMFALGTVLVTRQLLRHPSRRRRHPLRQHRVRRLRHADDRRPRPRTAVDLGDEPALRDQPALHRHLL